MSSERNVLLILVLICSVCIGDKNKVTAKNNNKKISAVELVIENPLLLISTLDGSLIAVDQRTGDIRWNLINEPVLKVPVDATKSISPLFLPDPKDGSLYMLGGPTGFDVLKKLPFTIPQLVASSPCRSSDGILYSGRKVDSWMAIDAETGKRQHVLGFGQDEVNMCPADSTRTIYIGRTEYSIMMINSVNKDRRWNVTFFEYSSAEMDGESIKNYGFAHFATNSVGRVVTLSRHTGKRLWEHDFKSPAVAMYQVQGDSIVSVPFTSVDVETLNSLQASISGPDTKLFQTLYVGRHVHGLYALPSLIDSTKTATISPSKSPLLIEGPTNKPEEPTETIPQPPATAHHPSSNPLDILLGHHQMPEYSKTQLQISGKSKYDPEVTINPGPTSDKISVSVQTEDHIIVSEWTILSKYFFAGNISEVLSTRLINAIMQSLKNFLLDNTIIKLTVLGLTVTVIVMFYYLHSRMKEIQEMTSNQTHLQLSTGSRGSTHSSEGSGVEAELHEEEGEQVIRVGKIELIPEKVLGRGCEGTFVFHGRFEGRPVAVKRLLPECFTVADREVDLLRESDEHPNVIRYFCTEKDRQFRYIALELCQATLEDYVSGRFDRSLISDVEVLVQATSGLAHLHALDIVHRDIKPHNVLLSYSNVRGEVRAMISDFGLCKKLQLGRRSFSHRSGVAGTDGWIAPEMINPNVSATCSVDIFSLGCVFYYVLSKGKHPFGDNLRRQANILSGEFNLDELLPKEHSLAYNLVEAMLSENSISRPTASAIIKHPFFWDSTRILTFFQDVSDRVESEEATSEVLLALEHGGWIVVQRDWRKHVGEEVASDLRKYRNYRGHSVRDLLRALRNKKHHYRDLSEEARKSLGQVPNEFLNYWISRFPLLLIHSWLAMQCVSLEPGFEEYYDLEYSFPRNVPSLMTENSEFKEEDNQEEEEEKNSTFSSPQKEWGKVWPDGVKNMGRKSQVRARKKPPPNPVWSINWRDPNQSVSRSNNGAEPQ